MTSKMEIPNCKLVFRSRKQKINKLSITITLLLFDLTYGNSKMQISYQMTQAQNKQVVKHDCVMTSLMEFPNAKYSLNFSNEK